MGPVPHDCSACCFGLAVAAMLRDRYPQNTAKMIARDLSELGNECTPKTAENILAGHLSAKSITRLTRAYGLGFLIDAGAAVTGKTLRQFIIEETEQARNERVEWERRERELAALEASLPDRLTPSRGELRALAQ